ncbi:glycosyltransferase [Modestobacter sp. NPDC049651]|uniref:glycosyltransferase n=1 Tax=unclassified Modestobacter TaxID=2643866 RepID=UPI00340E05C6
MPETATAPASRRRPGPGTAHRGRLVYGVTASLSATLLRGQLGWFRERGWDVHLVISPGALAESVAAGEGVHLHPLPMERGTSLLGDVVALWRWARLLRRLRPDVVNLATPKAALLGSVAAWATRVPVRVYEMWGLRLEGARGRAQAAVLWAVERLTVLLATDVVCVSASLRDEAARRRLLGRRPRAVVLGHGSSNGVDPARWDPGFAAVDRDAVRAGWGIAPGELVVGFVGRVCRDKGVQDLLEAFRSVGDEPLRLVLVGPVEDDELGARVAALGDRVVRFGMTDDLCPVYVGIDVLCLPTRREGLPNVVLEAALAQVPSITTTATGARDSVVDGRTGWLVDPGDVPALVRVLRSCAADREQVRSLGRAARERAITDFRPELVWSDLERVCLHDPVPTSLSDPAPTA